MKRFILKVLFLALLSIISIGILNFLYKRTEFWKNEYKAGKFFAMPDNIQLANFGSSHGGGFDYTGLPYRTFNFSFDNQLYPYDYALLSQYIEKFDKNAVAIILIEYFEVTNIKEPADQSQSWYYRILDKEYLPTYSWKEYLLYAAVPVLTAGTNIVKITIDIRIEGNSDYSTRVESERINNAKKRYDMWTKSIGLNLGIDSGEEGFAYNKNLVSKMIELCYAHDVQPVLISTPITSILNQIYAENSPDFFDTFYRFSRELQEAYPSLSYFDYSHDPRFENDFSLFVDQDHLNAAGSKKWTAIVIEDLKAAGILE
jgi:hypothetical protein